MTSPLWLSACLVVGSLAAGPDPAQAAPSPTPAPAALPPAAGHAGTGITWQAALAAAWPRAVAARESDALRRRADADRAVAASAWAGPPALALSHRDDRLQASAGRRETEIALALPLWLPGQRAARAGVADAAGAHALAAEPVARLRLAGELREAAWQLAGLQAEAAQGDAQAQSLQQLADDVARRVRAGDLARADALAAQAEHWAASAQQAEVRQRLQAARMRWALLTGLTEVPDLAPSPAADTTAAAPHPELHPELQVAVLASSLARQRVALLRHSRRDAPELTVGLRQDQPGQGQASQGSLVLGLRLPFGTDDRNLPLQAAALSDLDLAEAQERWQRERLASDVLAARDALQSAMTQRDAEAARARLLRERASLIDKSFRAGESPLPELLRALAAAAQADSALARQTAALGLAGARLQQALGLLP